MAALPPPTDSVVVMDRFVSASSSQDAVESLEQMVNGFKRNEEKWQISWVLEHEEMTDHLVWLLQHGTLKNSEIPCEEGLNGVCELYLYLAQDPRALQTPSPGRLLEALLDVIDHHGQQEIPIFVRVLALKVLEELSRRHVNMASNQWLQVPNGLHRLADILATDVDARPLEEAVRDQALSVAKLLAKQAPLAKVFLFAEVESKLLDICWNNGGLTKGKPIVFDALQLIVELLKHADASLQDLVWQRPNVAPRLQQLLDLRGGYEFLHPSNSKTRSSKKLSKAEDDDDLDDLLASGETGNASQDGDTGKEAYGALSLPKLLPSEVEVITLVLQILRLLLETDTLKQTIWKQNFDLCGLVWEMSLVNPSVPPNCALPSSQLQQDALALVAAKFNDPVNMSARHGLDRLLFQVCTGGYVADTFDQKLATSQSALAVLRHTLSPDAIHEILMHTLAPPPTDDDDLNANPPGPTVIQKLWNTVQENLPVEKSDQRTVFLSGALGGLCLMLWDEQSREIMSRVAPISMDQFLESVCSERDEFVQCSMLRFLCEWTYQCPFVAQNLLKSPSSTHLAGIASTPSDFQPLVHLLLGLAMEFLTEEGECGGWTRAGILQVFTNIGIARFTASLESLKIKSNSKMPWLVSDMEYNSWKEFCIKAVLIVRKRVVEELAGGPNNDESDAEDDGVDAASFAGAKSLRRLISQQAEEMEDLRQQLQASEAKVSSQACQLETWKRCMESTPSELDNMLSEFQSKTSKLEDTVRAMESEVKQLKLAKDAAEKDFQSKLSDCRQEFERLQSQEQEAREDLERTEQEMQALSQAYANLESEYQRSQSSLLGETPAGEESQQRDKYSQHQPGAGPLELMTLRAENDRLRTDAKAADDWMAMAVKKMNEMGASNAELSQQVTDLSNRLQQTQTSSQQGVQQQEMIERERQSLSSEVEQLKSSLVAATHEIENQQAKVAHLEKLALEADTELADLRGLRKLLESEQHRTAELESQVVHFDAEMKDLRGLRVVLESEKQRSAQLEAMLSEEKDRCSELMDALASEKEKSAELEKRLLENVHDNDKGVSEDVVAIQKDYDSLMAMKDAEILALSDSLKQARESTPRLDDKTLIPRLEAANKEVETIKEKADQDIYRLESVVRELKDRLESGLGAFSYEDIRSRDEEIEELRKANEAAQDWMSKAVDLHQMNAAQINKLTEEKTILTLQLEELRNKRSIVDEKTIQTIQQQLAEKTEELSMLKEKMKSRESEFEKLKQGMETNQELLDDLGIAMEDVGILKQKLMDEQRANAKLEALVSGSSIHAENEALRASNIELSSRIDEYQSWTEKAQAKLSEIMADKDALQNQLEAVCEENENLKAALADHTEDNASELKMLNDTIEELETSKKFLQDVIDKQKLELEDLAAETRHLRAKNEELSRNLLDADKLAETLQEVEKMAETNADQRAENVKLRGDLREKEEELKSANDALAEGEEVLQKWEDRVTELEIELSALRQQLEEDEKDALQAIDKWQESCMASEERCAELENNLQNAMEEKENLEKRLKLLEQNADPVESPLLESCDHVTTGADDASKVAKLEFALTEARETIAEDKDVLRQWEERTSELQTTVLSLQTQLKAKEETANETIKQWREACAAAEARCEVVEAELDSVTKNSAMSSKRKDESPAVQDILSKKDEELQAAKQALECSKLSYLELKEKIAKESDAAEAISNLQKETDIFKKQCLELQNELDKALADKEQCIRSIQEEKAGEILDLRNEMQSLNEDLKLRETEANKTIHLWEERWASSESENENLRQNLREAESLKELLATQESEANEAILQWEKRLEAADAENENLAKKLQEMESLKALASSQEFEAKNEAASWRERMAALEAELDDLRQKLSNEEILKEQLATKAKVSSEAISNLEQKIAASESEKEELKQLLEEAKADRCELNALRETVSQDEVVVSQWEARATELEETIETLEREVTALQSELDQQGRDANEAIEQWEINYSELETKCADYEAKLVRDSEMFADRNITIDQLEAENKDLSAQLDTLKMYAQVKPTLEADLVNACSEISRLTEVLESERQKRVEEREKYESKLADERERHAEARDEIETLQTTLGELKAESDDVVNQWTARYNELKETLVEVQDQLREQEEEANDAIESWESKVEELEKELDSAEKLVEKFRELLVVGPCDKGDLYELARQRLSSNAFTDQRLAEVAKRLEVAEMEAAEFKSKCQTLLESEERTKSEMESLKENYEDIVSISKNKAEEERDKLMYVIAELEEELREANEMVQAFITDESGDKATEATARALQEEVQDLRLQMAELSRKYEEEKAAKELASLEAERLRDDLIALVSLSEGSATNLDELTTTAIEKVQKRERAEIDEMRKSLYRALEDLDIASSSEREANEKLSKLRLQLTIYEQQIFVAKSEISFLTQAMEERREAEESKRASLEYRIGSLEHENDVLRRYHAAELDTVRSELSQITMERDRILHQLKESEKTNASLVYAGSKGDEKTAGEESEFETECAKLRIENAHLLTMAADDKARAERKIREMLAAQAASNEADVILQTELRVSAEAAVETLKVELDVLRNERNNSERISEDSEDKITQVQLEELRSLRMSLQSLKRENQELKVNLLEATREAQEKIDAITNECRTAQAKVHKMHQEGRFEALVQAEKTRLTQSPGRRAQEQNGGRSENMLTVDDDSSFLRAMQHHELSLSSAEAFDLIRKQKEEILAERKMYREFLQEHDDLLALLAQMDSEKTALVEALGHTAAEEALQRKKHDRSSESNGISVF